MDRLLVLAQNFHADGALASNHIGVIEGVDKGQPFFGSAGGRSHRHRRRFRHGAPLRHHELSPH
jgi:hypothetical protein